MSLKLREEQNKLQWVISSYYPEHHDGKRKKTAWAKFYKLQSWAVNCIPERDPPLISGAVSLYRSLPSAILQALAVLVSQLNLIRSESLLIPSPSWVLELLSKPRACANGGSSQAFPISLRSHFILPCPLVSQSHWFICFVFLLSVLFLTFKQSKFDLFCSFFFFFFFKWSRLWLMEVPRTGTVSKPQLRPTGAAGNPTARGQGLNPCLHSDQNHCS